jgi:4-hydroxybenzoate polyprenyltransferase
LNAGKFTFDDVKFLGLIQIVLGIIAALYLEYSLLIWALGFGVVHIVYGTYMYYRYER